MTTEITMLVWSAGLLLALVLVQAVSGILAQGAGPMAGSRDDLPPPKRFQARMKRVVDNHREGLIIFAALVLAGAAAGVHNQWTALGAQLFFYARVVHAALYIAGVPWVRPIAWAVGIVGTGMILVSLLGLL
ncbi:MAG TPA: MAPEG family protein [Parvularculaceae bacterium]|nr:MAPEG family protein [Parvularculaceae bacterium]